MDANLGRMVDALMDSEDFDEIVGDENIIPFQLGKMYKGIRTDSTGEYTSKYPHWESTSGGALCH